MEVNPFDVQNNLDTEDINTLDKLFIYTTKKIRIYTSKKNQNTTTLRTIEIIKLTRNVTCVKAKKKNKQMIQDL